MVEKEHRVYIHDVREINDEGPKTEISVNTRGETPANGQREEIYDRILRTGVAVEDLANEVDKNIGTVTFDENDNVVSFELDDWVREQYVR